LENAQDLSCKFIEVDRYGRGVLHCQADGLDVGSMMVQMGMAKDYRKYSGGYYTDEGYLFNAGQLEDGHRDLKCRKARPWRLRIQKSEALMLQSVPA
jgi:endonuclease YncB( thermonuclease family)